MMNSFYVNMPNQTSHNKMLISLFSNFRHFVVVGMIRVRLVMIKDKALISIIFAHIPIFIDNDHILRIYHYACKNEISRMVTIMNERVSCTNVSNYHLKQNILFLFATRVFRPKTIPDKWKFIKLCFLFYLSE